jgi:hypothetical protein
MNVGYVLVCICAETVDLTIYVKKLLYPINLTKR